MKENKSIDTTPEYLDLIKKISLTSIIVPRIDFALKDGCPLKQVRYEAKINRSPARIHFGSDHLNVEVGFQIHGIHETNEIFQGRFHFLVTFSFEDKAEVENLLEIEEIHKIFTGNQIDKLVWSYLRKTLMQTVVDAGLPPLILPLYR